MKRQPIYDALIAQLQGIAAAPYSIPIDINNISEAWVPWDNVTNFPAVFVVPEEETAIYERSKIFIKWQLKVAIWVYAQTQGQQLGVQTLSVILDAIEKILMPQQATPLGPPLFVNTLGGLVHQLAINGPTQISPGYLGQVTVARVPVEIITANP